MSNTLDDLFARDPDQLTRADIQQMIAEFRERRAQFKADEAAGRRPKAGKKKEAPVINLGDIILGDK